VLIVLSSLAFGLPRAQARQLPASRTLRTGVASSAADYPSWDVAFGGHLSIRMVFQSWAFDTAPSTVLEGPGIPMISWEPWQPTPAGTSAHAQGRPQARYSNAAIATGRWDAYLTQWAQAIKAYGREVILRPMQEFNGFWYPWSHNPQEFVLAWRHIWNVFHSVGADNVTWVWSFQVNADVQTAAWRADVRRYWPGRKYVDVLGMSLLRFKSGSSVPFYIAKLDLAHKLFKRPTMITEANVAYGERLPWLTELRDELAQRPYNEGFVWSQLPSQQQARNPGSGFMNWDARRDTAASALLTDIAALPF
jgi:hypothetical protein